MLRIRRYRSVGLSLTALALMSCADQPNSAITAPGNNRSALVISNGLSSPGWHEVARGLVATNGLPPWAAARAYSLLSVAQYRAVVDVDAQLGGGQSGDDGTVPTSGLGAGGRSLLEAQRGAVAGASAQVLSYLFPAGAPSFENRVHEEGEAGPGGVHPDFTRGLAIGRSAGDALVARAKADNFGAPWTGTVPVGLGKWVTNGPPAGTPLLVVTPWLLESRDQFRPGDPPAFGSAQFQAGVAEIRSISDTRTPTQRAIALDWNYGPFTFTPPGFWNLTAANFIESHGLNERAATHVFALMHAAILDAQIGCWEAKFHYWVMRPSQVDAAITLVLPLPNHPSYPSGHSCTSGAAETVLAHFFPDRTSEVADAAITGGLSRMYAGIHFRFDIETGRVLGNNVAAWEIGVDASKGLLNALR
jgi:membrane-associated phospholipid phosphatase